MSKKMQCRGNLDGHFGDVQLEVKVGNILNRTQKWKLVVRSSNSCDFNNRLSDAMKLAIIGYEYNHGNDVMGSTTYMFQRGADAMRAMTSLHLLLMSTMT